MCGLKVEAPGSPTGIPWYGGYFYLHKQVPFYSPIGPPRGSQLFNYVIAARVASVDEPTIAIDGDLALIRISDSCANPGFFEHPQLPLDRPPENLPVPITNGFR
jgi:hypothetical protein